MNKIYNNLTIDNLIETDWFNQFHRDKKKAVKDGINKNLDVSLYADPIFKTYQMNEIKKGLENNVDVSIYANPNFTWEQMKEMRLGLQVNLNVSIYAKKEFNWLQMKLIRLDLKDEMFLNMLKLNIIIS